MRFAELRHMWNFLMVEAIKEDLEFLEKRWTYLKENMVGERDG